MKQRILPAAIAALFLCGCTTFLTPAYERPSAPIPQNWPVQGPYQPDSL